MAKGIILNKANQELTLVDGQLGGKEFRDEDLSDLGVPTMFNYTPGAVTDRCPRPPCRSDEHGQRRPYGAKSEGALKRFVC